MLDGYKGTQMFRTKSIQKMTIEPLFDSGIRINSRRCMRPLPARGWRNDQSEDYSGVSLKSSDLSFMTMALLTACVQGFLTPDPIFDREKIR